MFDEQPSDPDVMIDINTTPLIDVMLVLLIMLIVTIPLQTHSVRLEMPVGTPAATILPDVVRVEIDAQGAITWNGQQVADRADLTARLREAAIAPNPPEVHIRSDKAAPYAHIAGVMAAAQSQGVIRLGVVGAEQFLD